MDTVRVVEMILPVVLALVIGAICGNKKIFNRDEVAAIKKFAVNISLTAVVFMAFATAEYRLNTILIPIMMYLVCLLAWYIGKVIVKHYPGTTVYLPYLLSGFEAGMLGYTLYSILYGSDISAFATVDLGQVLFVFTFYKIQISRSFAKDRKLNLRKEIFTSPIIIGILLGIIVGTTGLYHALVNAQVNAIFDQTVDFIAAPTSALILFSIGYDLSDGKIYWGKAIKFALLRLALMTVLLFGVLGIYSLIFEPNLAIKRAFILMFLMPTPFVLTIFANDPVEQSTIASVLSISTLISLLGFVVLAISGI